MAKIRAELSSYRELINALDAEKNDNQERITWDTFNYAGQKIFPHSSIVCKTPDFMKTMGFMPIIVYDRTHLMQAMYPEGAKDHAHGLSKEVLLELPKLLNKPIAIFGPKPDDEEIKRQKLSAIFQFEENGEQKLYRAIIQPKDYHDGIVTTGYATKIISFHEITDRKCMDLLNDVVQKTRPLLYFDQNQYQQLPTITQFNSLAYTPSFITSINGSYEPDKQLPSIMQYHRVALSQAIASEMNKLIVGRGQANTYLPLFGHLMRTLQIEGLGFKDYVNARKTIFQLIDPMKDEALKRGVKSHVDRLFAEIYQKSIQDRSDDFLGRVSGRLSRISVETTGGFDSLREEILKLASAAPTLENLNIKFSEPVSKLPVVTSASSASEAFDKTLAECMKNVWHEKIKEYNRTHTFDKVDFTDPLPGNRN